VDKSEVKKWVDANMERLLSEYGVPHWEVDVVFLQADESDLYGQCHTSPRYERATIELNCPKFKTLEKLEKTLRHEICHILHAPFNWYAIAVEDALRKLNGMEPLIASLDTVFDTACELTAKNLERMHHGHKEAYKRKR